MKPDSDDKALLDEVRYQLDLQVDELDFSIKSRLRQSRFHAIDHGALSSFHMGKWDYLKRGALAVGVLLVLNIVVINSYQLYLLHAMPTDASVLTKPEDEPKGSGGSQDTQEEIELYNWLYKHYG